MNIGIIDALIVIAIIICALGGFRRGFVKQTVLLVGLVIVCVLSFYLRSSIATFFYKNLPFINDSGLFSKLSSLNIIFYELIAFLVTFSVLYLVLRILLVVSGIIEKILKCTIILGFFSRIGGMIIGAIEGYILVFIALFVLNQPFFSVNELNNSKFNDIILDKTPILSSSVHNLRGFSNEIKKIIDSYKSEEAEEFNDKTIDLLLKYDIVSKENIDYLKEKGKLK